MTSFAREYLAETAAIAGRLDAEAIDRMASALADVRTRGGRLFILGAGGGAGHASHAVNDFRKICEIETYSPVDNVSELTARINDDGWDVAYRDSLRVSRLGANDALLVFSVGGGSRERNVSTSLVLAIEEAKRVGAGVYAVIGRPDGFAAQESDICVVVECPPERLTAHTEEFQAVVWHLLVSHPALARFAGTWETLTGDDQR